MVVAGTTAASVDLLAFVPMQEPLPSQDIDEGPPGQCAVAGLVLGFLRPLGHGRGLTLLG